MELIIFLVVGLIAGFAASHFMGKKQDLVTNLIIGVVGAVVGGVIAAILGIAVYGILGRIVIATLGAMLCLWLWQKYKRG